MENNTQQFIDLIKSVVQTCEDSDREKIAAEKEKKGYKCRLKEGFSHNFDFSYRDSVYSREVEGRFEYYDTGLYFRSSKYETEELPFPSLSFLTREVYTNEVEPAVRSWLEEKVQSEPFGGLFGGKFTLSLVIYGGNIEISEDITVTDQKRLDTQREMIHALVQDRVYEKMDTESDEYHSAIKDIMATIPTFYGELPTDLLKDAIATISKKYKEADSWYFSNAVLIPLLSACDGVLIKRWINERGWAQQKITDETIPDEHLDFLCWIGLQVIRYADDSNMRQSGESIFHYISEKGYKKAKDYLKFGSGKFEKEHAHLKTKKFEAIANDIRRTIQFKVKEEDAESYGGMLDFIINLIKLGFPKDYQIKINSKLKNYIPVTGINHKSKTNLFFGNAASFPELWDKMREYVSVIFDDYKYYSDATDEQAVTVGGYAVYALGAADLKTNMTFVDDYLSGVDFEHDVTARSFVEDYMDKKTQRKYLP